MVALGCRHLLLLRQLNGVVSRVDLERLIAKFGCLFSHGTDLQLEESWTVFSAVDWRLLT